MEIIKAVVECIEGRHFIRIGSADNWIGIPMSEDKPREVKNAFNELITRLKSGQFQIELEEVDEDLFSQVADEYVSQLNRELQEVYSEMLQYGLIDEPIDL